MMKKFRVEMIMNLPEEILVELIFLKLCLKTVVRLRCVCKRWRDLIKTQYFGEGNFRANCIYSDQNQIFVRKVMDSRYTDEHQVLLSLDPQQLSSQRVKPPAILKTMSHMIISCNGILCYWERRKVDLCYLYNPTTEELVTVPPSFHTNICRASNALGFGFDSSSNDYKLVRVWERKNYNDSVAEIYRLGTNSWSEVCMEEGKTMAVFPWGVFVKGMYYWLRNDSEKILTFNFQDDKFGVMHQLPSPNSLNYKDMLAVLDDSLALCSCTVEMWTNRTERMDVWIMKESWSKAYSVYLKPSRIRSVCACWKYGTNLVLMGDKGQLVMVAGKDDNTGVMLPGLDCFKSFGGLCFRPSLISPRNGRSVFQPS